MEWGCKAGAQLTPAVLTEVLGPIQDFIVMGPGPHNHQVSSFTE